MQTASTRHWGDKAEQKFELHLFPHFLLRKRFKLNRKLDFLNLFRLYVWVQKLTAFCSSVSVFLRASGRGWWKVKDWNGSNCDHNARHFTAYLTHFDRTARWGAGSTGKISLWGAPLETAGGWKRRWPKPWKPPTHPPQTDHLWDKKLKNAIFSRFVLL